jgi:hypothetical protein
MRLHTRHIPRRHLATDTPMAKAVIDNGLCDTLAPENLARLADIGVDTVETRLVWWEVEPRQNEWDFSAVRADLEAIRAAGLRPGLFLWTQHPPAWYRGREETTCLSCLEHGEDSTILSIWDPATPEAYRRIYEKLLVELGDLIEWVTLGITGDFGEYAFPGGIRHYRFSPSHGHGGFWCGDRRARADFARWLREKYQSEAALRAAWTDPTASFERAMPTAGEIAAGTGGADGRLADFARWYLRSMDVFAERVCQQFRGCMPEMPAVLPVGFPGEPLSVGQLKSSAARIAARYGLYCRWTGVGHWEQLGRANVLTRRLSSAVRDSGGRFATEAALVITRENAPSCLFEIFSNGSQLIHDDTGNIFRAEDFYRRWIRDLPRGEPRCSAACWYPCEAELLGRAAVPDHGAVVAWLGRLRGLMDYEIFDLAMLDAGYAKGFEDVIFPPGAELPGPILSRLRETPPPGARVWFPAGGPEAEGLAVRPLSQREGLSPGLWACPRELPEPTGVYETRLDTGQGPCRLVADLPAGRIETRRG